MHEFQGNCAIQLLVVRLPHLAHAAASNKARNGVAAEALSFRDIEGKSACDESHRMAQKAICARVLADQPFYTALQRQIALARFAQPRAPGFAVHFPAGKKQIEQPV